MTLCKHTHTHNCKFLLFSFLFIFFEKNCFPFSLFYSEYSKAVAWLFTVYKYPFSKFHCSRLIFWSLKSTARIFCAGREDWQGSKNNDDYNNDDDDDDFLQKCDTHVVVHVVQLLLFSLFKWCFWVRERCASTHIEAMKKTLWIKRKRKKRTIVVRGNGWLPYCKPPLPGCCRRQMTLLCVDQGAITGS